MPPAAPAAPSPGARPIRDALDDSAPLQSLARRLRESQARHATVLPALPEALRSQVRPGPIDEAGWSLLAANAAVAAKLRHLLPRVEDALRAHGWPERTIRIRITSG